MKKSAIVGGVDSKLKYLDSMTGYNKSVNLAITN